jgi:hypothetical protein
MIFTKNKEKDKFALWGLSAKLERSKLLLVRLPAVIGHYLEFL